MNVLSLFDGMSCGQMALERAGISVSNYYASEIDKYAIKVTKANYPETIHLGDVLEVKGSDLPKIDLIIGGSPCQGFSFAGKQLNFEDPRSKLLFEYVRLVKECKPTYFLLENVRMKKQYQDVITGLLGVEPIMINSALVSAQNRKRLYWTNIPGASQPTDTCTLLEDVLQCGGNTVYQRARGNNPGGIREDKSPCMGSSAWEQNVTVMSEGTTRRLEGYGVKFLDGSEKKAKCLSAGDYSKNGKQANYLRFEPVDEKYYIDPKQAITLLDKQTKAGKIGYIGGDCQATRLYDIHGKSVSLSAEGGGQGAKTGLYVMPVSHANRVGRKQNGRRIAPDNSKAFTLTTQDRHGVLKDSRIRKLTPKECERLQTVPDDYTDHVSNTQRYKMLGNGWTVDVVAHLLKGLLSAQD